MLPVPSFNQSLELGPSCHTCPLNTAKTNRCPAANAISAQNQAVRAATKAQKWSDFNRLHGLPYEYFEKDSAHVPTAHFEAAQRAINECQGPGTIAISATVPAHISALDPFFTNFEKEQHQAHNLYEHTASTNRENALRRIEAVPTISTFVSWLRIKSGIRELPPTNNQ